MSREHEGRNIGVVAFYACLLLLGYLAYRIVEPFLVQIGWAIVLAICLDPLQDRLQQRLGATRSALVLTVLTLVLLILPAAFAVTALVTEGGQIVANLQAKLADRGGAAAWLHTAWVFLRDKFPFLPPEEAAVVRVTSSVGDVASFTASRAGGLVAGALSVLFGLLITLFVLFFLLRDAQTFAATLRRLLPFGPAQSTRLVVLTRDLVSASVRATVAIATIQGLVGGVGFAVLGIEGAAVWGLMMGILSFLPLVGATLVWLPAAVWLLLSGSVGKGVALLALGLVVLGNVDNVVRPLVLSGTARMNTLVMLVSLMGGVSAFGFIGIVLGPLVAAVVTALVESYGAEGDPPPGAPPSGEAPG